MIRAFIKFVLKFVTLILFRVKIVRKREYRKRKSLCFVPKPCK